MLRHWTLGFHHVDLSSKVTPTFGYGSLKLKTNKKLSREIIGKPWGQQKIHEGLGHVTHDKGGAKEIRGPFDESGSRTTTLASFP